MTEIKVMCDYCAAGLWENGEAIDIDILANDYNIQEKSIKKLRSKIEKWQDLYEGFEFWDPNIKNKDIRSRPDYKKFIKMGPKIAVRVKNILPTNVLVIYFDENNYKEYVVESNGTMVPFKRKTNG